jgi:hypothetical protein
MVDNFIIDATDTAATNAKWTSTTEQTWTVPAGKRWLFWGGSVLNSADATVTCIIQNATPKTVMQLCSIAAPGAAVGAAVRVQYPDSDINYINLPIPMDTGWSVKLTMGAAQGAAAEATCLVTEFHRD